MEYAYITTIGQDSHAFDMTKGEANIMLGAIEIPNAHPYIANSDGDVVLHSITNAISGFTCRNILGGVADKMCLEQGIKDSREYLKVALEDLKNIKGVSIVHVSMTIECKRPKLSPHIEKMRLSLISALLQRQEKVLPDLAGEKGFRSYPLLVSALSCLTLKDQFCVIDILFGSDLDVGVRTLNKMYLKMDCLSK